VPPVPLSFVPEASSGPATEKYHFNKFWRNYRKHLLVERVYRLIKYCLDLNSMSETILGFCNQNSFGLPI
jgi:hypothetical protein